MSESSMPWVKIYTDFLDDPKIGQLSDPIKLRFIQIILIAGECDADGALVIADKAMTQAEVSWRLRVDRAQLATEMSALRDAGVLMEVEGVWSVVNFAKRQGRSQSERREKWRKWQQAHRAKKEQLSDAGPKWVIDVMPDSGMTHAGVSAKEKSKSREDIGAGAPKELSNTPPQPFSAPSVANAAEKIEKMDAILLTHAGKDANEKAILRAQTSDNAKALMSEFYRTSRLPFDKTWVKVAQEMDGQNVTPADVARAYKKLHDDKMNVNSLFSVKKTAIALVAERKGKAEAAIEHEVIDGEHVYRM